MENRESVFVNLDLFGSEREDHEKITTIPLLGRDKCPGSFALTPASMTTAATVYGLISAGVIGGKVARWKNLIPRKGRYKILQCSIAEP